MHGKTISSVQILTLPNDHLHSPNESPLKVSFTIEYLAHSATNFLWGI